MVNQVKTSDEIKVKSVKAYINGEGSLSTISHKVGISERQFREWIRKYKTNGVEGLIRVNKKRYYSDTIKQSAIEEYRSGKSTLDYLCSKYNISDHSVLRSWIMKYNNHNKSKSHNTREHKIMIKGRKTTYNERIEIVEFCITNNSNYPLTSEKYNVSYQQVYSWVRKYKKEGTEALVDNRGKSKSKENISEKDKLAAEIKLLKAQNKRLEMENDFLKKLEEIERRLR